MSTKKAKTEYNNLYKSAYTGVPYPAISKTTKDEITNASDKVTGTITPKCNISFGNLGKFNFDFLNLPTFEPLEMKMFNKIKRLNEITRGINDRLISIINELECCGLGYEYNKQVLPIFEFLLHDFSTILVDIAKGMLKAWQVIDIALCIIRPVPGNPWMKGAGYDWFNPLYSIAEGFANVFKWFVDGNPLDVIINPMDKFYKKLKSCVPLNKGLMNTNGDIVFNDRFNEMLEVYKQNYIKDTTKSDQTASDIRTTRLVYENLLDRRNKIIKKLSIPTQGRIDEEIVDKKKEQKIIEDNIAQSKARQEEINRLIPKLSILVPVPEDDILNLQEELDSIQFTIESDESTYESLRIDIAALEHYTVTDYIKSLEIELAQVNEEIAEYNSKYLALTGDALKETNAQNNNDYIIRKSLKQLAIEDNKPSCLCLLTLLGIGPIQIPEYKTIFYTSDLESVEGRVMYEDRTYYNNYSENIADLNGEVDSDMYNDLKELFINQDKDFSNYKLNRNLMLQVETLAAEGDLATGNLTNTISYKSYTLDPEMIDGKEHFFFREETKDLDVSQMRPGKEHLYIDQDFTKITEVLNHNDEIYIEKLQVTQELNIYKQDMVNTETKLRVWWEEYRKYILNKIKYFKIQNIQNELNSNSNDILNSMSEVISPIQNADHVAMLGILGESFNPSRLMENYSSIIYYSGEQELDQFMILKEEYFSKDTRIKEHEALLARLELKVKLNNVELELIGQLNICGCDLICKLIQYILDLIMSVIQAIIQIIVARIIQMIMNEYVTYVLRFIQEKMKCLLKIIYFKDQQELIEKASKSVEALLKAPLNEMKNTASCTRDEISELIEKLKSDEIKFKVPNAPIDTPEFDHTIPPDPTFGDPVLVEEPENVLVNHRGKVQDLKTERNIPTLRLDCEEPSYLELEIRDRNKFEIMISFIPSEYIYEAEIIETVQTKSPQTVDVNGETLVLDQIKNPVDDIQKILDQVNEQVQNVYNSPKFIEQCGTSNSENTVLCNTDNLQISYLKQVDPNNQNNLIENNESTTLGKLYGLSTVGFGMEVFEERDGELRQLAIGENYWRFEAPIKKVNEYSVSNVEEYIVQELGEQYIPYESGHVVIDNTNYISNYIKYYITTTTTYTYEDRGSVLYEIRNIVKDTVEVNIFNHQHIELVGRFANTVNYLDIRILFSIVNYVFDQQYEKYYNSNYTGRFIDYVELGGMASADELDTVSKIYNISEKTLIELSTNILRDNMIISEQTIMDQAAKDVEDKKTDLCNVDTTTKESAQFDQAIVDNIALSIENAKLELESFSLNDTDYEIPSTNIDPMLKSIPLLILNDTHNISIEIVNKRIQLQMPTEMFYDNATVLEHDLIAGKTYMLSFNTDGLIYKLKLITEEKEIFEASGINQNFYKLFPTKVGGDTTRTFCGVQILDIILSKLGSNTINYYIRSNLSFVPRNAQIVFDFKLYNGNQVFNTINAAGLSYSGLNSSALQKADMYGNIIRNEFYQVMHGYMDNFFCKDNLGDKDFTISLWIYNLSRTGEGRQYIISDDVNNNYIYYFENQIVMDFNGQVKYAIISLNNWAHVTLKYKLYESRYDLNIKVIDGSSYKLSINTKHKFFLMSLLARYSNQHRMYIDKMDALLGPVSIFMYTLNDSEINTLFDNQNILVKGMQNAIN